MAGISRHVFLQMRIFLEFTRAKDDPKSYHVIFVTIISCFEH